MYWIMLKQPRGEDQSTESNLVSEEQAAQPGSSKTLNDLLDQAKVVELPNVNTDGWQTYRSDKLGFEFMYPKGWVVKEHFENRLCVETEDNRYAKKPDSIAQKLQGDECIVQINEHQTDKITFSNEWVRQNSDSSFSKAITQNQNHLLLIKDSSLSHVYLEIQGKIYYLSVWNENLAIDTIIADVLYGILQTFKPIQK